MKIILVALLFAGILLMACALERPGNVAVYDRIDGLTSCTELQQEFNTAMDDVERRQPGGKVRAVSLAYAEYADDRMKEVGCY